MESTVAAILALSEANSREWVGARGSDGPAVDSVIDRSLGWLATLQRPDGGWAPQAEVRTSTWVTALVLLLPKRYLKRFNWKKGVEWLAHNTGRETGWIQRVRTALITGKLPDPSPGGWPFYPDTAAWVVPTAYSILALQKLRKYFTAPELGNQSDLSDRISNGRAFLLSHRCSDGGWNHGSTRALGYESTSYPETTGLALLSLKGAAPEPGLASLGASIAVARRHLIATRSREAVRWLELGLLAHGEQVTPKFPAPGHRARLTNELALDIIVTAATRPGRNGASAFETEVEAGGGQ